ncbi:MAG: prephenate dehydrogenase [Sporolactobacillus sp.]|jgi:prephenate dehydrogenase|nr:prephenate dehydrogenase [Sporolactobacillus sp.]
MKTIVIDGLGLIGGSIALAIRKTWPGHRILAVDVDHEALSIAKDRGMIDSGFRRLETAVGEADVIIMAAPIHIILAHLERLADLSLKPQVIVTDVGSTKSAILERAKPLAQRGIRFIGGHPMAGSHKSTVRAARANLFQSAYYFLVPAAAEPRYREAVRVLRTLLAGLNVKWLTVTAERHDRIVAQISHLPHIVAAALVNLAQDSFSDSPLSLRLAAGGFHSITRIASSDPTMWTDILLNNRRLLIDKIDSFDCLLRKIRQALISTDDESIRSFFQRAKTTRDGLNRQSGPARNFYDLFINIPDKIGSIAEVTSVLTTAGINLVNLHILEIREEIDGVLQLTFSSEKDRTQAASELSRHGWRALGGDGSWRK